MEKLEPDSIQAFDALYTTNQIQVLKLLLPFCSPQTQRSLAILIRLLELNYTIGLSGPTRRPSMPLPTPFLFRICASKSAASARRSCRPCWISSCPSKTPCRCMSR
ncbi:MAG TPA: hypothetical protein H9912_08885 [Candidatus Eisenbergiella stercorigallinarum]|uniref:Uncharacterized protein n=1 Tax=Candidatus Eisenbergiella stercorigallinarum TaxID=2838557 RepID=A0A9D2R376_9FIRM|nr:hypothetical protein [Candidatus Eisenbergiella stercorigallinarum]